MTMGGFGSAQATRCLRTYSSFNSRPRSGAAGIGRKPSFMRTWCLVRRSRRSVFSCTTNSAMSALDGRARVPDEAGVDHQVCVVAESATCLADEVHIGLRALTHRRPAELHRAESAVADALREFARLARGCTEKRA